MARRKGKKAKLRKENRFAIFLDLVLILIGIWLLLDGYISIIIQIDEPFEFQFFRVVRSLLGFLTLLIGLIALRHNLKK